jgi:4,5-DOPA dioxygenase extradiol
MSDIGLFLSHGSPLTLAEDTRARAFLVELGQTLPKPKAVLAVSAHWTTRQPAIGGAAWPETIHDFFGFPDFLYERRYPAPGAPELAQKVVGLLGEGAALDPERGLDHGIWTVMSLLWPDRDVPVVPMAVQPRQGARYHYEMGQKLKPLAEDGVLILGTGAATHNLRAYMGNQPGVAPQPWVLAFTDWLAATAAEGDTEALIDYRARAPFAVENHPTDEHLLPFHVVLGATGRAERIHASVEYGVIAMDDYRFR